MITSPLSLLVGRDRLRGYEQAMQDAGRSIDRALIVEGGYGEHHGYHQMQHLINIGVDAVFVSSDIMALGALDALRFELGYRIPEEVMVVTLGGGQQRWSHRHRHRGPLIPH